MLKYVYGFIAIISLLLIWGYCKQIKERQSWFVLLYSSVFVVNLGYFMLSVSNTLNMALWANRVSYLGSVMLPLCMLMIILDVCKIKCRTWIVYILSAISGIVFLIAASGGITDWYYKDVTITFVRGAAKLVKEYGPLHNVYYVYLFSYLIAMVAVILYAYKKKHIFELKHASFLVCVVLGNIGIWFVEQMIKEDFEFLSISYVFTEVILLFLYGILEEINLQKYRIAYENSEVLGISKSLDDFIENCHYLSCLTSREKEVLKPILEDKKRKDIADALNVSESTIKKHTAHIFAKLEVSSRKELYAKIGYKL